MKKLIGFLLGITLLLGAAYLGATYYMGIQTEQTLAHRSATLDKNTWLQVVSRQYERRWFDATETVTVQAHPQVLAKVKDSLPEQLQTLLNEPVTLVSHVRHGPLIGTLPARAQIETEFRFTPPAQKILKQFFGDAVPVTMRDIVQFTGGGTLQAEISKFDYQELSGIQIIWDGLTATMRYSTNYQQYDTDVRSPGLQLILADMGKVSYKDLSYRVHTEDTRPVATGNSLLNIKRLALSWQQDADYRLQLNDLINMVSDLQIGSFVNPTLSIPPSEVSLDDLSFSTSMALQQGFVSAGGKLTFAKLNYGDDLYDGLNVEVQAEHLNAEALAALKQKLADLSVQSGSADSWREEVLSAIRNEGAPLFTDNPILTLKNFSLNTPSGKIAVQGKMAFENLAAADLNDFNLLLPKVAADMSYEMPQQMIESFAQAQVRSLFAVADNADQSDLQDIQNTARLMVDNLLQNMHADGYLKLENGIISGTITLVKGQVLMNGQVVQRTDSSEIDEMLDDDKHFTDPSAASEPESAASAPDNPEQAASAATP
ncbi:MAG: YdgA family protein [Neisseria sp.]|nr:YdgA family protein [Neisseria sp.]